MNIFISLLEKKEFKYEEAPVYLKISTVDLVTCGEPDIPDGAESQVLVDKNNGIYRRLNFKNNKLPIIAKAKLDCSKKFFIKKTQNETQWRKNCLSIQTQ